MGGVSGVSEFFFTKNPNLKEKKLFFFGGGWVEGVSGWGAGVSFGGDAGTGELVGGGAGESEFFLTIESKFQI